jgi:hypothetical protein
VPQFSNNFLDFGWIETQMAKHRTDPNKFDWLGYQSAVIKERSECEVMSYFQTY